MKFCVREVLCTACMRARVKIRTWISDRSTSALAARSTGMWKSGT
jgi:hypothetical protein